MGGQTLGGGATAAACLAPTMATPSSSPVEGPLHERQVLPGRKLWPWTRSHTRTPGPSLYQLPTAPGRGPRLGPGFESARLHIINSIAIDLSCGGLCFCWPGLADRLDAKSIGIGQQAACKKPHARARSVAPRSVQFDDGAGGATDLGRPWYVHSQPCALPRTFPPARTSRLQARGSSSDKKARSKQGSRAHREKREKEGCRLLLNLLFMSGRHSGTVPDLMRAPC